MKEERRGAERYAPPKPVPASFGGFDVRIIDISLIGCRIEHTDRLPPKAKLALRFSWRMKPTRIDATVARSELTSHGGKPAYISGLEFCATPEESPAVVRDIVAFLAPPPAPPAPEAEVVDELSAPYLRCTLEGGQWLKVFVDDPTQPKNGFTIAAPADEHEADVLCRAYAEASTDKRRMMRESFQRDMARKK